MTSKNEWGILNTDPTPSQVPSNPYHYVGGEMFAANKSAVLSPYLALIGLIAILSVVAVKRNRLQ
jgi:hypothetical protein